MPDAPQDSDARFLDRVAAYRDAFRKTRMSVLSEDRKRHHEAGQVFVFGHWVGRDDARRLVQRIKRHELLTFTEVVALLTILLVTVYGIWRLFKFLLLPFAG